MSQSAVGLVGCSKAKLAHAAPAHELYISPLFRKAAEVCSIRFSEWAILSAKHGLIDPEQVISPYDESLTTMSAGRRRAWGQRVAREISERWTDPRVFHLFAGRHYMAALADLQHVDELKGLSVGHRLKRLNAMLREGT